MGPTGGRATAFAVDPTSSSVLYAGFAQGGVFRSEDAGASWVPIFDQVATSAVGAITIDPATHAIWVGTGDPALFVGSEGKGLYVSTDGGTTWTKRGGDGFDRKAIAKILFDGTDMYLAVTFAELGTGDGCTRLGTDEPGQGLYRSNDGGHTFTLLRQGSAVDVAIDASATPHRIYVSNFRAGASKSDDDGMTWQPLVGVPKATMVQLAIAKANPAYVYAGSDNGSKAAIYVSSDHGATFAPMQGAPNYCETQCDYDNAIAVDPTSPDKLYVGGNLCGVWGTAAATQSTPAWKNLSAFNGDCGPMDANWYLGFVHPDVHALTLDPSNPSVVYASTDGGIARSQDAGQTWERLDNTLGTIQFYGLCVDPTDPTIIYGGAQDNGSMKSAGTSLKWRGVITGDGGPCAIDPADPKTVLLSVTGGTLFQSTNRFAIPPTIPVFSADPSFCSTEPGCGDRTGFISPLASDPATPHTFYVGTYRLWKSDQGGTEKSWKAISPDLTAGKSSVACTVAGSFKEDDVLTAIAASASASGTIFTGSAGGVLQRTTDDGATWTAVSKDPLPARYVSSIAIDPLDATRVYVAFSGLSTDTPMAPGHVFRSNDGGETWTPADIPDDEPVDSLIAHPVGPGLLYAGTENGVLFTEDGGSTWAPLGNGLPRSAVYSLAFQKQTATLVAGTHGRSAWTITMPPANLSATPSSLTFSVEIGQGDPAPQTIRATATDDLGASVDFNATADAAWITGLPVSGAAAGAEGTPIPVAIAVDGLDIGSYDGNVVLTGTKGTVTVPVHLDITPAPPPMKPTPPVAKPKGGCGCRVADAPADGRWIVAALAIAAYARRLKPSPPSPLP